MKDLEQAIVDLVHSSIGEAVKTQLTNGYASNPLAKMVQKVVESREPQLLKLIEEAIDGGISCNFRDTLKTAIAHKLGKVLVSKMEGEIEKRVNDLRSNPETRAKIILAVGEAIKSLG